MNLNHKNIDCRGTGRNCKGPVCKFLDLFLCRGSCNTPLLHDLYAGYNQIFVIATVTYSSQDDFP